MIGDKLWMCSVKASFSAAGLVLALMCLPIGAYAITGDMKTDVAWLGGLSAQEVLAWATMVLALALVAVVGFAFKMIVSGPMAKLAELSAKQDVREVQLTSLLQKVGDELMACRFRSGDEPQPHHKRG